MRDPDWKIRIHDMIASLEANDGYTAALSFGDFSNLPLVIDATLRHLTVIGEAASRLPEHVKQNNPTVPWRQIKSMRNRRVHDYRGTDLDIVWQTIRHDLPDLLTSLRQIANNQS
ncbi:MAG: DUF86 domain-containing protein [Hyphomicrobium sp.]